MDAPQFLAEFGHIANAPGGVAQLRKLVLQLAIQGKLVEQDSSDTPARTLLKEIEAEKKRLVNAGRIKQPKSLPPIKPKEISYQLPQGWEWVRLPECYFGIGNKSNQIQTKDYLENGQFPVIDQGNNFIVGYCDDQSKLLQIDNPVIVFGDHTKNIKFIDFNFVIGADGVKVLNPYIGISAKFLYRLIQSFDLTDRGYARHFKVLNEKLIPLAPLEEQSRIVAKVDELMALCDTLKAQQQARRKLQNKLRLSTLQAVTSATSPHELQTTWARLADNFGRLFHAPEDVADLRNLILDLAANGFLSEPQADDGDPLAILSQASLQQKVEFSAREFREINALPELTHENGRFRIALGRIVKLVSGQHLSPEEYNTRQDGIPYITGPAEFKDRRPSPTKWTTERRAIARVGDVLITVKGSGVGKTALCDLEELAISRQLMAIRALANLDRRYLSICIDSAERSFQEQKFGIAIPGIGRDEVLALTVLLPSIEEQGRIVRRVDELMRLCDSLESQLRSSQKVAVRLVIGAVSSLTGIAIEQEEEPMKAPQTELIAPLRLGAAPDIKTQAPLATILARHNGEMSAKDLWQRFGGEIDAFYAQLKTEVVHGWILEPATAEMREKPAEAVSA
ncbi:MAG: hypothetical protein RLZZ298_687 [Pseudomonadota bacterium]|jgi:type I restriction enzyme S subunit